MERPFCVVELKDFCLYGSHLDSSDLRLWRNFPSLGLIDFCWSCCFQFVWHFLWCIFEISRFPSSSYHDLTIWCSVYFISVANVALIECHPTCSSGMPSLSCPNILTVCLRDFSISLDFNLNVYCIHWIFMMVVFFVVALYVQIVLFRMLLFHTFHRSFGL